MTAIQLMPIAGFPGRRNWGYDGVSLFSPDSSYGSPDDLKDLISAAHAKGLIVFNDVVYNHFGPEGNYLHRHARAFFSNRFNTPWGKAINFDTEHSHWVRWFFIHNAMYWLEEYHFDGLRFDAVHALFDESSPDILEELAEAVRLGQGYDRPVYLVLENDNNTARYLNASSGTYRYYDAQWNDDLHHALHVLLTGETAGYYQDYHQPMQHLGRCLTEGFSYQGEASVYRDGIRRGESCSDIPLTAFVSFLQNHDQIGNRPLGRRISCLCPDAAVRAVTAIVLLAPSPPMLFMGQEWASKQPVTYFVDFPETLGDKVNQGRSQEFARMKGFAEDAKNLKIPLPNALETYLSAKLAWNELTLAPHRQWLECHRGLLGIRSRRISPKLPGMAGGQAHYRLMDDSAITVQWRLNDGSMLLLAANLGANEAKCECSLNGDVLFATDADVEFNLQQGFLKPWSVIFFQKVAEPG